MKKLALRLDQLNVDSFATDQTRGHVHARLFITAYTQCFCTQQEGCYPSLYCTGDGPYELTCAANCETNANGQC